MDESTETWCSVCVYHPPNLPREAYAAADWQELQSRHCAYDCLPGSADCLAWRKTSCSLVDLEALKARNRGQ